MRAQELGNEKLVIFDIDDTLVNTDTRVNVVRDGKVIKQLNSHDFTHYKLGPGEEFDFGALLGCHAQSRILMDDDHIIVPADPTKAYGEVEFLDYLQFTGYTVEYIYEAAVQI